VGTSTRGEPPPRAADARVQEHQNLGIAFYKTGMLDEAQREFRRVADLRPDDPRAQFHLGLIALKQARWEEAISCFSTATTGGAAAAAALHNLAFAAEQLGRLDEAESAYADAASRSRDDPRIQIGWALVALKRNDPEVSLGRLSRAAELLGSRPRPATWYWAMTLSLACDGQIEEAIRIAQEGVGAHTGRPALRNNLAVFMELSGDLTGAEMMLRTALAEDATLAQACKNLGDLLYRAGRYDDAFEQFERAAKLSPAMGDDVYFKMGNIAFKRRDRSRARECWQRVTELNPGHQLARANLDTLEASA
jgi:tetratricopeptide (TPR) repeat protein